jgi:hypothetical protein
VPAWAVTVLSAAVFLIVAAATVVVTLVGAPGLKSHWYFVLALALVAVVAGAAAQSQFRKWLARHVDDRESKRARERDRRRARDVEVALRVGLGQILKHAGLPPDETGVYAYLISRPGAGRRQEMRRVAGFHLSVVRPPISVRWTKGKGVIGACWRMSQFAVADLTELADAVLGPPVISASKDERLGLTDKDLEAVRDRGVEAAEPIFDRERATVGCVTLEAPTGSMRIVEEDRVRDELAVIARAVWIAQTQAKA